MTRPVILAVDLDCFFAAAETLDAPALAGTPVLVGSAGPRGVVATANYEARAFGCRSAMPMADALRRCPHATVVPPRFDRYRELSRAVMAILAAATPTGACRDGIDRPLLQVVSIDEAYLDWTAHHDWDRDDPADLRARIDTLRTRIRTEVGITASVGASTSKTVAKIASDDAKPDGTVVVPAGTEAGYLAALPARRIGGIGPVTAERLDDAGIRTCADLAAAPADVVADVLGNRAGELVDAAAGIDPRPVDAAPRIAKSVSAEHTVDRDITRVVDLVTAAQAAAVGACARLDADGRGARTVTVKVRYRNFDTITRSVTRAQPTRDHTELIATAMATASRLDPRRGIRLVGVALAGLDEPGAAQGELPLDVGPGTRWPGAGWRCVHPTFGAGWVIAANRELAVVDFDDGACRTLELGLAGLRPEPRARS